MSDEARYDLVMACTRLLYVNGQGTEQVLAASHRLARVLGLNAMLSLRWGEVQLQLQEGNRTIWSVTANPAGVDMTRVIQGMQVIDDIEAGRGSILMPFARRQRMSFAAIGFIAVVAMIPACYLVTMAAGL